MTRSFPITVHWRQAGRVIRHQVPEGEYILRSFEHQGDPLPFSCRNGCCTACAVRVLHGEIDHREALGLSRELRESGYGLLDDLSLVTAPYAVDNQVVGVLGVIGPTRMAYERVIPIVDITAKLLGSALRGT